MNTVNTEDKQKEFCWFVTSVVMATIVVIGLVIYGG